MYYQSEKTKNSWQHILLRSAGWLALQAGKTQEAVYFAELGLENQPPQRYVQQFQHLLNEINPKTDDTTKKKEQNIPEISIQLKGILTQANANQKEIYLKNLEDQQVYSIRVPEELINEIVKSFWSATVTIEGKTNPLGVITLEKIQLAA